METPIDDSSQQRLYKTEASSHSRPTSDRCREACNLPDARLTECKMHREASELNLPPIPPRASSHRGWQGMRSAGTTGA